MSERRRGRERPHYEPTKRRLTYREHNADRVVAEINNGGEMVEATLRMVDPNVAFTSVRATRGKVVRAQPVAALYEQRRVHHVGSFPKLEDQMCGFTPDFDREAAGYSPDRVDALVWAFTDLLVERMAGEGIFELYRQQAAKAAAEKAAVSNQGCCGESNQGRHRTDQRRLSTPSTGTKRPSPTIPTERLMEMVRGDTGASPSSDRSAAAHWHAVMEETGAPGPCALAIASWPCGAYMPDNFRTVDPVEG